jgi:hypothetical protein
MTITMQQVPCLAIANSEYGQKFAYSPPMNRSTVKFSDDVSRKFAGPRTAVKLLSNAAAGGEVLPIKQPFNTSKYSMDFYGPITRCNDANSSAVDQIDKALANFMATPVDTSSPDEIAYYAFVPMFDE